MPSILNSDDGVVSGTSGLKTTGGNDGLLNIQSNGSTIVAVTGSGISVTGTVSQTGVSTFAAGTVSAPSITFTGDTNTGIFSPAADTIAFTEGGVEALRLNSSGVAVFVNDATVNGATVGRGAGSVATNTALGASALAANTTGANNTAVGSLALDANTTGANNVAVGSNALGACTTGQFNTAIGVQALQAITTGTYNTAIGYQAGYSSNVAGVGAGCFIGQATGYSSTGAKNTFVGGDAAGYDMTTGASNTILGNFRGNQDGLDIRTSSNYAIISDGDGNRLLSMYNGGTLALDGGAVPQAGTGITFPATQSASTNANTLDDYEEGTWTPALTYSTPGTLSVGYQTVQGFYTKIGNVVNFSCFVQLNAFTKGTASGTLQITGLPFTAQNPGNNETPISWSVYDTPLPTGAGQFPTPIVEDNATIISLIYATNNGVNVSWPDADSSSQYKLNGKYFV